MEAAEPLWTHPPSPSFYTKNRPKNWSKEFIKAGLCVDDVVYARLYVAMEVKMTQQNLLRLKLNTRQNKTAAGTGAYGGYGGV